MTTIISLGPTTASSISARSMAFRPTTAQRTGCPGAGGRKGRCFQRPVNGPFCAYCADELMLGGIEPRSVVVSQTPVSVQKAPTVVVASHPVCRCGSVKEEGQAVCRPCFLLGRAAVWLIVAIGEFCRQKIAVPSPVRTAPPAQPRQPSEWDRKRAEAAHLAAVANAKRESREFEAKVVASALEQFKARPSAMSFEFVVDEARQLTANAKRADGSAQIVIVVRGPEGFTTKSFTVTSPDVEVFLGKERALRLVEQRRAAEEATRQAATQRRTRAVVEAAKPKKEKKGGGKGGGKKQ